MKKIGNILIAAIGMLLICCSSSDASITPAQITVSPDKIEMPSDGGKITVTVTCDGEWGIYATESWVTTTPTGGLSGTSQVEITIAANSSQEEGRSAELIVKSGETRASAAIVQGKKVEELAIADAKLKTHLLANYDTDGDGVFSKLEAAAITDLDMAGLSVASFDELPAFTGLVSLDCSGNTIGSLDLKAATNLTTLKCANNRLTELDIRQNKALKTLDCTGNAIDKIYVWSGFTAPSGFTVPAGVTYVLPDMFVPEGYTLLWSDEFEGTALDTSCWTAETGTGASGWGNNELQYYTAREENVTVKEGCLVITAIKENYNGSPATSARLITLGKMAFKYGYVVASIRLPKTADGLWPAFWMMGNDFSEVGWPKCGETDILEMGHADGIKAGTQERYLNGACHWGQSYANHVTYDYSVQDGEFHTFTCIWDEQSISMYIDLESHPDAKPYFKMDITAEMGNNVFRKENFILLNLAVGGNFPGIHDISGVTGLMDGKATMEVDYVRVFQKK